ncbi:helix-turn-helix domain-containing protein [Nucisporomicrobium flavum]|uniref:helix-turn-helix domain-containing protein n=1 Tax=Nucisporomicrobium flavum TaxID=2785915 RepID=UPI0018F6B1A0|nr:helix-turn-helix transcriptional regulator [Nucisporomicrobium flavum]
MRHDDDFGAVVRTFRARLSPAAAGVTAAGPATRRVPGLRRAELAELAGISEDHLRRLEQGRRRPSPAVTDALARALALNAKDHSRLRASAGFAEPGTAAMPRELTPAAVRLLDRMTEFPACVCDASWTVLTGNAAWQAQDCGARTARGRDRNMAWRVFTGVPGAVHRSPGALENLRSSLVAGLHTAVRRYGQDRELRALVTDLAAASPAFARLWATDPGVPPGWVDTMTVRRPGAGDVELDKDVLIVEPGDLRVVVFTEPRGGGERAARPTAGRPFPKDTALSR